MFFNDVFIMERKMNKRNIDNYVKNHNLQFPTVKEIARSVPPGLQEDAREQKIGNRIWIGKCSIYGCKMWYSENDVKRIIRLRQEK